MAEIAKREGIKCTYYTGTAGDLIAAGLVRKDQFPPEGKTQIAYLQGVQVDGRCASDETYIRVEVLDDGNVTVQLGLPREEQRARRSAVMRQSHRERNARHAQWVAERAAEEAENRKDAADRARNDLAALIDSEEAFRKLAARRVRDWLGDAINLFAMPVDHHAFAMSEESIEDIRMSVDAVVEAIKRAEVHFDAAKHRQIITGHEVTIRAADPSFYAQLDKLVAPKSFPPRGRSIMSRRCKSGQRARVIHPGRNSGKIVLVIRPYFGEEVSGAKWEVDFYPWVVAGLSGPLAWKGTEDPSILGAAMTIVMDDADLQPLDHDDDGLTRSTEKDKPKSKPKAAKPKPEMADPQAS